MARRGVKKKDHERLDDATIARVVLLLEQEKPITKKAACETLNISYNTKRLGDIVQEYKDKIEFTKKRIKINKGQPFSDLEIKELVIDYLNGDSITNIAASLYRSLHVVKKKIKELHLPERTKGSDYFHPELIPNEAIAEIFYPEELVWSARYNTVAEIKKDHGCDLDMESRVYTLFVFGKHNQFAYQPAFELGKLDIVKQFDIPAEKFVKTEKSQFNYRID